MMVKKLGLEEFFF